MVVQDRAWELVKQFFRAVVYGDPDRGSQRFPQGAKAFWKPGKGRMDLLSRAERSFGGNRCSTWILDAQAGRASEPPEREEGVSS